VTKTATLPTRLAEARARAGLSIRALADRLGEHQTSVHRWESGAVEPRASVVARLAEALGVSADWLLGRN